MANQTTTARKYGNITFSQANDDLKTVMTSKGGALADLSTASYGTVIREMFAAHADVLGFWTESAFNNSWLETATAQEAGYVGARSLGYSVRRPVPAKAGMSLQLTRTGSYSTVKVLVPRGTVFAIAGNKMTAIDDIEFLYDRNLDTAQNGNFTLVSGRSILCEGVFKSTQFFSDGTQFQEFLVLDSTLSNWFGDQDPNFTEPDVMDARINRFTVVTSDSGLVDNFTPVPGHEENVYWRIDRRGLVDPDSSKTINDLSVYSNDGNYTLNYSCLLSTANDGRVKLEFGDGVISAIPYGQITLSYFSTRGSTGNVSNVAGFTLNPEGTAILITQDDGSPSDLTLDDLNFALTTDITGGMDIESLESIQKNAPSVFNTLDSLGNRTSYSRYLNSVSNVKYAIAFGEDILSRYSTGSTNLKYSNLVRFTCLKDLYRQQDGNYYVTDPYEYMLSGYKVNGLLYLWDYDYSELPDSTYIAAQDNAIQSMRERMAYDAVTITRADGSVLTVDEFISGYLPKLNTSLVPNTVFSTNLRPTDFVVQGSELYDVMSSLNRRGYLTMGGGQHSYIPPTVHDMGMSIALVLYEGSNFSDIKTTVLNAAFAYLRENTAFASPIFASAIESIIQNLPETAGVNVTFKAIDNGYSALDLTSLTWLGQSTQKFVDNAGLTLAGFDMNFAMNAYYSLTDGSISPVVDTTPVSIMVGDQSTISAQIAEYYTSNLAYLSSNGDYLIKTNVTEKDLVAFCSYIWSIAINAVYSSLYNQYLAYASSGDIKNKTKIMNLIETVKTWNFVNGAIDFVDNDFIKGLSETTSNLYNYINYTINYIKLVRDIIKPVIAGNLIDSAGNVTKYSNSHEIVQFHVSASDFSITYGTENYRSN